MTTKRDRERMAVHKHGTANQLERYDAGALPQEELLALARAELFGPLAGFSRWAGRYRASLMSSVRHTQSASRSAPPRGCGRVGISQVATTTFSPRAWDRLKKIEAGLATIRQHPWISESDVSLTTVSHVATCADCGATASRPVARVEIRWAERVLVREYAL